MQIPLVESRLALSYSSWFSDSGFAFFVRWLRSAHFLFGGTMINTENKGSTNLSKVSTPQELISYLSSNDRVDSSKQVYHYTRLSSILNIIKSGYWIMRSPKGMNDSFEYQNWNESDWKNIFFISFMDILFNIFTITN